MYNLDLLPMSRTYVVPVFFYSTDDGSCVSGVDYGPYDCGTALNVWLKAPNGSTSMARFVTN